MWGMEGVMFLRTSDPAPYSGGIEMPLRDVRTLRRWPLSRHTGWCARSARAGPRGACSTARSCRWRRARSWRCWAAPARASRRCCTCSAGSTESEAGVVEVAGERLTGASERRLSAIRRRHIGFVFQSSTCCPS